MGFRDKFLQSPKSYTELHLDRIIRSESSAAVEQCKLAVKAFRERLLGVSTELAEGADPAQTLLAKELADLAEDQEWQQVRPAQRSMRQWEIAALIARLAGLLGGPWMEVRWGLERTTQDGARSLGAALQSLPALQGEQLSKAIDQFEQGEYGDAKDRFQKILTSVPLQFHAHVYRGWCCVMLDRDEDPLMHFERAAKLSPYQSVHALVALFAAQARWASGDVRMALDHAERAAQMSPLSAEGWYGLARIAELAGKTERAREALWHAIRLDPLCWGAIATDPFLEPVRPQIFGALEALRARIGESAREVQMEVETLLPLAEKVEAVQTVGQVRKILADLEPRLRTENFFLVEEARRSLAACGTLLRRTVTENIEGSRARIEQLIERNEVEKRNRIATAREPLEDLRRRRAIVAANYTPWQFGCVSYGGLWLLFAIVLIWMDVPGMARTQEGLYTAVVLILLLWVFPLVVIGLVNFFRKRELMTKPLRELDRQIQQASEQFDRNRAEFEEEHEKIAQQHSSALENLALLEKQLKGEEAGGDTGKSQTAA